jgi:long-chain acyl-CoA synthetase
MNLATNLTESATRDGSRIALRLDDYELSCTALDAGSERVAGMLRDMQVQPGDRVGIMLPNVPHFAVAYYGVLRAGAVAVPINVLLKDREVQYHLEDSGARILLVWEDFADEAQRAADTAGAGCVLVEPVGFAQLLAATEPAGGVTSRDSDDTAVILYTSGTTGKPKGAELTHANLTRNTQISVDMFGLTELDVIFGALPLFHALGQTCCLNAAIRAGASLTLLPRFDPGKALEIIERDRVTIFVGVPTMYTAMLHHSGAESIDTSTLRLCGSGGASLPVEVLRGFEEHFGCMVLEGYGLSETSPVASFHLPDRVRKVGSIGIPMPGSR